MWRVNNIDKQKAYRIIHKAIRKGKLSPKNCLICGGSDDIMAHHDNYRKPLEVDWLCRDCHGLWHQILNEWERQGLTA